MIQVNIYKFKVFYLFPSFVLSVEGPDQSILNFPLVYSPGGQKLYEEINWNLMRLLSGDEREVKYKLFKPELHHTEHHLYIQNCS